MEWFSGLLLFISFSFPFLLSPIKLIFIVMERFGQKCEKHVLVHLVSFLFTHLTILYHHFFDLLLYIQHLKIFDEPIHTVCVELSDRLTSNLSTVNQLKMIDMDDIFLLTTLDVLGRTMFSLNFQVPIFIFYLFL